MLFLALAAWTALTTSSTTVGHESVVQANGAPEVFFGLRTYTPTMYDGMARYGCEVSACRDIVEVNSHFGIGKLRDGRFIQLSRSGQPGRRPLIGSLSEASGGRMTQWSRAVPAPAKVPEIANYSFSVAQPLIERGSYVGLWHSSRAGAPQQTLVILFNDSSEEVTNRNQDCWPYRVLAAVHQRVNILETRPLLHIGEAISLASYDDGAKAVWLARLIVAERDIACR